jgi:hypothetical protein
MLMSMHDPTVEPAPNVREKSSFHVVAVELKVSVVDWVGGLNELVEKGPNDISTPSFVSNLRATELPEAIPELRLPAIDS